MLEDKVSSYLDLISKAAMKAGPQVMQFAVLHEHWCGVGDLAIGFFLLFVSAVALLVCFRHRRDNDLTVCGTSGGIGAGFLIVSTFSLLNIWNWVAVFNPKIALFHDILTKFLEH